MEHLRTRQDRTPANAGLVRATPLAATAERRQPTAMRDREGGLEGQGLQRDFSRVPVSSATPKKGPPKAPPSSSKGGFWQALGSFFGDFFSEPGAALDRLVGGTSYSNAELTTYLSNLTKRRDIEGDFDSDNKARAVIERWKSAKAGFNLTGLQKMLLIRELQDGATLDSDERAILDLLKRCENGDLRIIFSAIPIDDLLGDFDGAELKELKDWLELRFENGLDGLRKDAPKPEGKIPHNAPNFPYNRAILLAKFESGEYEAQEIIEDLGRRPLGEREQASKDLAVARTTLHRKIHEVNDRRIKATDKAAKEAIEAELERLVARRRRMDIVMQEGFKDVVLAETPTELEGKKKTLTPAEKTAAREALKPELRPASGGAPPAFIKKLPSESKDYTEKLRECAPTMIQAYWDAIAKDRQAADHADSSKMHTLKEMEDLAAVSKDETDAVFGGYYDKARHPPMKADTPTRRNSLHDLWADTEAFLSDPRTTFAAKQALARALMFYFFQSDTKFVAALNREHNASPRFDSADRPLNDEAVAQSAIADEFTRTAAQVRKLNEIDRAWDASANPATRDVNIQLFKPAGGAPADQDFMWDMFQTLIHEYLHTLVHRDYVTFASSFGSTSPENNTLMEGMDSFLDEVVWANIQPRVNDAELRKKVEGPAYAALPPIQVKHAMRRRYASYTEAVRLVNIVGFRNVVLAYFKGDVAGIGA